MASMLEEFNALKEESVDAEKTTSNSMIEEFNALKPMEEENVTPVKQTQTPIVQDEQSDSDKQFMLKHPNLWAAKETAKDLVNATVVNPVKSMLSGAARGAATLYGAGDVLGIPGAGNLADVSEDVSKKLQPANDIISEGIKSTTQSLVAGVPGAAAGAVAAGPMGAVLGFAAGGGGTFALDEYRGFMKELRAFGESKGMSKEDIDKFASENRLHAINSAIYEGGLEAASDLLQAKFMGLFGARGGRQAMRELGRPFLDKAARNFVKVAPTEIATEMATTTGQTYERGAAGLPTENLGDALLQTAGVAGVQSLIMSALGVPGAKVSREYRKTVNEIAKATGMSTAAVRKGLEDIANRDLVKQEVPEVTPEITDQLTDLDNAAKMQGGFEEISALSAEREGLRKSLESKSRQDRIKKAILGREKSMLEEYNELMSTPSDYEEVKTYESPLIKEEKEELSPAKSSIPSGQELLPTAQEEEAGETITKQPVTFIGMQEMPNIEKYKGIAPMVMVNTAEGSSIKYDPESMEITNPEAYESAVNPSVEDVIQEAKSGDIDRPLSILKIPSTQEVKGDNENRKGLSRSERAQRRKGKKEESGRTLQDETRSVGETEASGVLQAPREEVNGPSDEDLKSTEEWLKGIDKEDISDHELMSMLSDESPSSVSEVKQRKNTLSESIDNYSNKIAEHEDRIASEQGYNTMDAAQLTEAYTNLLSQTGMSAKDAKETLGRIDTILSRLYDLTGNDTALRNYGNYEIVKTGRGSYSIELAGDTLKEVVQEDSEVKDPVLNNPWHKGLAEAQAVIEVMKARGISASKSDFPTFISAHISEAFANGGEGLASVEKNMLGILDALENKDSGFYSELVRNNTPGIVQQYREDMYAVAEYYEAVKERINKGTAFMSDPFLIQSLTQAIKRLRIGRSFPKWKKANAGVNGTNTPKIVDKTKEQKDIHLFRSYLEGALKINDKNFPDIARTLETMMFMSSADNAVWSTEDDVYIHRITASMTEEERRWMMKAGSAIYMLSRTALKANLDAGMDKKTAIEFKDMYTERAMKVIFRNKPKLESIYREIRSEYLEPQRNRLQQHFMLEAEQNPRRDFMDALRLYKKNMSAPNGALTAALAYGITSSKDLEAFSSYVKGYIAKVEELKTWGFEDYWPHYMSGNMLIKADGKVISKADDRELANLRIEEHFKKNPDVKEYTIESGMGYMGDESTPVTRRQFFAVQRRFEKAGITMPQGIVRIKPGSIFAGPLADTKYVLPGEDDIRKALLIYSKAINKKIAFDPSVWMLNRHRDSFAPNVREHVNDVWETMKGRYWEGDRIVDEFFNKAGHRLYSRAINASRTAFVIAKLGYDIKKGIFNGVANYGATLQQFREGMFGAGAKYMRSPEGQAFLSTIKNYMGERAFTEGTGLEAGVRFGHHLIKGKVAWLTPLGTFNMLELPGRKWNAACAHEFYIGKEKALGRAYSPEMEEEAKIFTIQSLNMLQGLTTSTMMGKLFRSPTGRLMTLFKPFMVRDIERMIYNRHDPKFWATFIPWMFAMVGMRGLWQMLATLPFLNWAFGKRGYGDVLSKTHLEMLMWKGALLKVAASGIAGLADKDIIAPMTWQFPQNALDWLSVPGMAIKSIMDLTSALMSDNRGEELKDFGKKNIAVAKLVTENIEAYLNKDGWVYQDGKKQFNIFTPTDKYFFGPLGVRSNIQSAQLYIDKINQEATKFKAEKIRSIKEEYATAYKDYTARGSIEIPQRVIKNIEEKAQRYMITSLDLAGAAESSQMTPAMRSLMQALDTEKLKVYKRSKGAGEAMEYNFLTGKYTTTP